VTIRGSRTAIPVVLALASATVAAAAAAGTPGALAIAEKRAELTNHWGTAWELLAPTQKQFISRTLFVSCMGRIRANRPKAIKITSIRSASILVPAPQPLRLRGRIVRLHIDYGQAAPSQDVVTKVVSSGGMWYWVNPAGSRAQFERQNFCQS
jgi:hypothetical protein